MLAIFTRYINPHKLLPVGINQIDGLFNLAPTFRRLVEVVGPAPNQRGNEQRCSTNEGMNKGVPLLKKKEPFLKRKSTYKYSLPSSDFWFGYLSF